jgi:hypothetical protein
MYRFKFNPGKTALMLLQEACGSGNGHIVDNKAIMTMFELACSQCSSIPIIKMVRAFGIEYHTHCEGLKYAKDLVESYGVTENFPENNTSTFRIHDLETALEATRQDLLALGSELNAVNEGFGEEMTKNAENSKLILKLQKDSERADEAFKYMNAMIDEKNEMIDEYKTKLTALEQYVGIRK